MARRSSRSREAAHAGRYQTLAGPDPFAALRRLRPDAARGIPASDRAGAFPAVNLWQGADSIAVTAEIPGVAPADIDITVHDDRVVISGERRGPEADDESVWLRRERAYGRFSRAIRLPYRVDPDRVEARFQDGVLRIELQRPEADKPRRIHIASA